MIYSFDGLESITHGQGGCGQCVHLMLSKQPIARIRTLPLVGQAFESARTKEVEVIPSQPNIILIIRCQDRRRNSNT